MFKISEDADKFYDFSSTRHKLITFTIEKYQDQKLLFLDVLITKPNINNKITKTCKNAGLLTNYLNFIHERYKLGLIKTLVGCL